MTNNTKSAEVFEVPLATAFDHWNDMVRVPQRPAREPFPPPMLQQPQPMGSTGAFQIDVGRVCVDPANGAYTAIAGEDLFAQITGIGANAPLVNAPIRTKRESPRRDLEIAPATQRTSARTFLQSVAIGEAAGHGSGRAHNNPE